MTDRVCLGEFRVSLWLDTCPSWEQAWQGRKSHQGLWRTLGDVVRILRRSGWRIGLGRIRKGDARAAWKFDNRIGNRWETGLRAKVEVSGRRLEIEVWQTSRAVNSFGPQHDFDKFELMTFLQRAETTVLLRKIARQLSETYAVPVIAGPRDLGPREGLRGGGTFESWWSESIASLGCHYKEDLGRAEYSNGDRDRRAGCGGLLEHLGVGWTMDRGRWVRGTLYYHLNNMWIVRTSRYSRLHRPCWEIRVVRPDRLKGRQVQAEEASRRRLDLIAKAQKEGRWADVSRLAAIHGRLHDED